ncbi:MAG: hypothetical protein ACRDVK_10915 [Acidimicrobiia bacterium]
MAAAFCLLVACGAPEQGAEGDKSTEASNAVGTTTIDPTQPSTISEAEEEADMDLVHRALLDLARRLKVAEDQIEVLEVEQVSWPDGSLGCPQPGQMHTQALVEGHRIVLGHGERVFLYHSGGDVPPFLCESDEIDGGYGFIPPPSFGER